MHLARRLVRLTLAVLAVPGLAAAQSHPCDQAGPATQTIPVGVPHKLQFCQPGTDNPEALLVVVDGRVNDLLPIQARTQPSATGLVLYETDLFLSVEGGTHALTAATYNRNAATGQLQVGPASPPFTFAAVVETPLPAAPAVKGAVR